ncbi:hypothetical protein PFICI_06952 [Pestalotiopsis fici W106-1]|uniref:Uncharacterized protein n=1 Tax=Pestalotiopsis fici (strain W106-1 / CGMCC3.15140) TaxID=1229662 RepID=W3X7B1_PESFW|nr:uncharacterized protein PFICI_06952 [Pestalotiopsis fici W106-1]ETS81950.1 hypothetical protein PFICI_06952 [Pestalotiopsis fici W106-1]
MFTPVYGPGPPRMSSSHGHRYSSSSRHSSIQHLPVIEEVPPPAEKSALRPLVSAAFWFPASPPPTYHFGVGSDSSGVEDNVENVWVPPMNGPRRTRRRTRLWYRRPAWLAGRGGWRRLALFATFVLVCVVGLILGLTLGLRRNNPDSPDSVMAANQFPAGSYAFKTTLASTSTACTTNADTFRCYPHTSRNASATGSEATFLWTIALSSQSSSSSSSSLQQPEYIVSAAASSSPFMISFTNVSVTVLDRGNDAERLSFQIPMDLGVVPTGDDGGGGGSATCWFNGTATLGATIWTRRPPSLLNRSSSSGGGGGGDGGNGSSSSNGTEPVGIVETARTATSASSTSSFTPWPFAVEIERSAAAAPDVPTCVNTKGNTLGQFGVAAGGGSCICVYDNLGTAS